MIDRKFGIVLKNLRSKQNLSQEELALRTDLHRTYISQLERGLKSPSLRTIEKLCKELNISLVGLMSLLEQEK